MAFRRRIELLAGEKNNEALKITDLKISFNVMKTKGGKNKENNAKIQVYNVNEETSNMLCKAGNHVILKAGYEDEIVKTILIGDIVKGEVTREGTEKVVTLEVMDGRNQLLKGRISIGFGKNTDAVTIAQSFIDALGFPVKGLENIPNDKYKHGFSFIGMAFDGLKQVLDKYDLEYSVQNEMLYIKKAGQSIQNLGLNLRFDSGLLSSPRNVSEKEAKDMGGNSTHKWKFKTLLFPQLVPGVVCRVESDTYTGQIKISEVLFSGDNFSGDFICEIIGEEA